MIEFSPFSSLIMKYVWEMIRRHVRVSLKMTMVAKEKSRPQRLTRDDFYVVLESIDMCNDGGGPSSC